VPCLRRDADVLAEPAQTVSVWLNRKRDPNLQTLLMLADFVELAGDRLVNAPSTSCLEPTWRIRTAFAVLRRRSSDTNGRYERSTPVRRSA
jgi:hypothetical protein